MEPSPPFKSPLRQYWRTLFLFAGVTGLCTFLEPFLGYRSIGFVFLFCVLLLGAVSSMGPILFSAALGALAWNYFFIPPRFTLIIRSADDAIMCVSFLVVAVTVGYLTNQIRFQERKVREREDRLREARHLEESEKLHQTLLNSISHEIRTPLTTIMGTASALESGSAANDPAYVRSMASQLMEASDRLNRVTENLLDMSRLNSGFLALKLEWHDVSDLVGVVMKKLAKNLTQRSVKVSVPSSTPLVRMDFRFLEHALANLLLNAAAYTPRETPLQIVIETTPEALLLLVDDAGSGIPVSDHERIFEKFYRVPGSRTGGTGLGLSIVRSFVEAHHGKVTVGTSPLGGARFTIRLPLEEAPPAYESEGVPS